MNADQICFQTRGQFL